MSAYKLVPVEPTPEMLEAAGERVDVLLDAFGASAPADMMVREVMKAALAAAPQPEQQPVGELPPLPEPHDIEWPEYHHQGMGCGIEDRGITDRYEAAEHGWECAIDRAAESLPLLFSEDQMREYARAALAAAPAPAADVWELVEALEEIVDIWRQPHSILFPAKALKHLGGIARAALAKHGGAA